MSSLFQYFFLAMLGFFVLSCGTDDPPPLEEEEEIITKVDLVFTSSTGQITLGSAIDPDGEGPQNLNATDQIVLTPNTDYTLSIMLLNTIANEDITEEVKDEGEEHQFFFSWTEGLFASPTGNGNIDNPSDSVNYRDTDTNGLPVGIESFWSTGDSNSGTFRVLLKHQPGSKTSSSNSGTGDTDIDLTWPILVGQ